MSKRYDEFPRCGWCGEIYNRERYPGAYCSPKCRGEAAIEGLVAWLGEYDVLLSIPPLVVEKTQESDSAWVRTEDRLPEAGKRVLVFLHWLREMEKGVWRASEDTGELRWYLGGGTWYDRDDVTHWRPLPEPPIVEPEQKREVGCCGDCEHWKREPAYQDEWGACLVLTRSASPYVQNRANLFALKEPQSLRTHRRFSCIEHQPKNDA